MCLESAATIRTRAVVFGGVTAYARAVAIRGHKGVVTVTTSISSSTYTFCSKICSVPTIVPHTPSVARTPMTTSVRYGSLRALASARRPNGSQPLHCTRLCLAISCMSLQRQGKTGHGRTPPTCCCEWRHNHGQNCSQAALSPTTGRWSSPSPCPCHKGPAQE